MKSEFMVAITQLAAEKNLPKDVVLATVESAIASAYHKDLYPTNETVRATIDPNTGAVRVFLKKKVVETVTDAYIEMTLAEARKIKKDHQLEDMVELEVTTPNAGRIAAQKVKQFILRRLHEAEHQSIFEEFQSKAGTIVTGVVQRVEPGQITVDLGRVEAILPEHEQVRNRHYRPGQRLKLYLVETVKSMRGAQIIVSHAHAGLLRKLMEVEIPEIYNGNVEIKAVSREAGYRSKVAVTAKQEGVDPVGSCVGLRGIRIQNIVNELSGEKIDVVQWMPSVQAFIANALSPAQVVGVELREPENAATVLVPEKQLSLAIGKDGQNARLAAKLTGWRIDIKPAVPVEPKKAEEKPAEVKVETAEAVVEKPETEPVAAPKAEKPVVAEVKPAAPAGVAHAAPVAKPAPAGEKPAPAVELVPELPEPEVEEEEEAGGEVSIEEVLASMSRLEAAARAGAGQIRFSEDIMMPSSTKAGKKKKKLTKRDERIIARKAAKTGPGESSAEDRDKG
jgi:N utilization substance protein A